MPELLISEVARQIGLKASAIRYYEQIGILPPARRSSGQRRYDSTVLYRLAVVQRARQMGFTLDEIRRLFFGFRKAVTASDRWKKLSEKKLADLELLAAQIREMQRLLKSMSEDCNCHTLDQCGKGMFLRQCGDISLKAPAGNRGLKRRNN
ncbi:MAG TPA: MerR family transcriptional regulator [Candidatus Angelobacter sp.]|nr:MerR family transcriptional regulator [Candidatus Angelobacter sp.]